MTFHTREGKPERKAAKHDYKARPEQHYDIFGHDTNDLSSCDRKKRYRSKQHAKNAVRLMWRKGWKQYAYECRVCRSWHLTSQDPAVTRRQRRGWAGMRAVHEQESAPTVQKPESAHRAASVLPPMTDEKADMTEEKKKSDHADIARAAGYASAEELGATAATLDGLCRECRLSTMVLGGAKFYPIEDVQKQLAARAVPDGMVAAIDWAREHGIERNRIPNAIRDGKYPGRSHFGKTPGLVGKSRYYIVAEEAADYCGLNRKVEAEQPPLDERYGVKPPTRGEWMNLDRAAAVSGIAKATIREHGDDGDVQSKVEKGEYLVLWDDLEAYSWMKYQEELTSKTIEAPPPTVVSINEDVLRMLREANERQREMYSEMRELVEQMKSLESRIDAKLAAGAAVWKKTVADRDAALAQTIGEAVAQALDEHDGRPASPSPPTTLAPGVSVRRAM